MSGFPSSPLTEHKDRGREAEQKRQEQLLLQQHVRPTHGEMFRVHVQSYWTFIILLVTSPFASQVPRFPTLKKKKIKSLSHLSEKLGLYSLLLQLWSGQPAWAAVSVFPY